MSRARCGIFYVARSMRDGGFYVASHADGASLLAEGGRTYATREDAERAAGRKNAARRGAIQANRSRAVRSMDLAALRLTARLGVLSGYDEGSLDAVAAEIARREEGAGDV